MSGKQEGPPVFLADEPIRSVEDDQLGRGPFVQQLAQGIRHWQRPEPLVIGLSGAWGQGKTSVLHLVANALEQEPRLILATYNPWDFNSTESLVQGFLSALEGALSRKLDLGKLAGVKSRFRQLRTAVSSVEVGAGGVKLGFSTERLTSTRPVDQLIDEITQYLNEADIRIIVFVDDLDRLGADDLLTTLKLVRLARRFQRITYVLAFDRNRAEEILKDHARVPPEFIEKIINVDVPLPPVRRGQIDRILDEGLTAVFEGANVKLPDGFGDRFAPVYQQSLASWITTLRDVKRYLNALAFTLPLVVGEVNYVDHALLEAIRVFSPSAYQALYERRHAVASFDSSGIFDAMIKRNQEERRQALDAMMARVGDADAPAIRGVLSAVFPQFEAYPSRANTIYASSHIGRDWRREQRACHPDYVDRYFMFTLDESEVSDTEVHQTIAAINDADADGVMRVVVAALGKWDADHQATFINKVRVIHENVRADRRVAFAQAIARSSGLLHKSDQPFGPAPIKQAEWLIFDLLNGVTDPDERTPMLCEIARACTRTYLAIDLLVDALPSDRDRVMELPPVNEAAVLKCLRGIITDRLVTGNEHVYESEGSAGIRILYVWSHRLGGRDAVTDYVLQLAAQDPCILGRLLAAYFNPGFPDEPQTLRLGELNQTYDASRLYEAAKVQAANAVSCEPAYRNAIEVFIEQFPVAGESRPQADETDVCSEDEIDADSAGDGTA